MPVTALYASLLACLFVPLALLALAETLGTPLWALLAGRCAHACGMSQPDEDFHFRVGEMTPTFAALLRAAAACFVVLAARSFRL